MSTRIMGIETEYALVSAEPTGTDRPADLCRSAMRAACEHLPHLPCEEGGIFLQNGARLYIDSGNHLEYATPECTTPDELVSHVRAGDRLLTMLVKDHSGGVLLRSNVDYASGSTWGSHESYSHRNPSQKAVAELLMPHLISRIIYTGAGGFHPDRQGIEFAISPRLHFFSRGPSDSTLALHSTRNESLASRGYRRLHVTTGESLCSDVALWLRVATTCMIVALAEAGACADISRLKPGRPVEAFRKFTADPTLRTTCTTKSGEELTALEMQRRCLACVQTQIEHPLLPDWAEEACACWQAMLELVAQGANALAYTCDWAMKYRLFHDHLALRNQSFDDPLDGPPWGDAPRSSRSLDVDRLCEELGIAARRPLTRRRRRQPRRPSSSTAEDATLFSYLRDTLREHLWVLDNRFTEPATGYFDRMQSKWRHRMPNVTDETIRHAMEHAPETSRAKCRGEMVKRYRGNSDHYSVTWMAICDLERHRSYRIGDPTRTTGRWKADFKPQELRNDISDAYNRGDYATVLRFVPLAVEDARNREQRRDAAELLNYQAWVEARTGNTTNATETLDQSDEDREHHEKVMQRVAVLRFTGLTPTHTDIWNWIDEAAAIDRSHCPDVWNAAFEGYRGHALMKAGRLEEAEEALRASLSYGLQFANQKRLEAMYQCDLANCLRQRGADEEAGRLLESARALFEAHEFGWELYDAWYPNALKLQSDDAPLRSRLEDAKRRARGVGNHIGYVRLLLLESRASSVSGAPSMLPRSVSRLRAQVADLRVCPLLQKIIDHWDEWVRGGASPDPDDHDRYWRL